MRRLSLTDARRLAVLGQLLGGPRPSSIPEVVERLVRVQQDPTSIVDRAERLTLWSRLGPYDRDDLRRLLEEEPRRLFEYNAWLLLVDDLPLYRSTMRHYPPIGYGRGQYIAGWLRDNAEFRAYILSELRSRGPLRSRDLDDRAEVPWETGGWNDGKNLGRMLEVLWLCGDIAVTRRDGAQRVWDLFERVLPASDNVELPEQAVIIELMERQLRAAGLVAPGWGGALDVGRLAGRELGEESLLLDGIAVPVEIEGVRGEWLTHRDLLAQLDGGAWQPRTTLLGPFDPLIHDRERTMTLFAYSFAFELYKPAARRQYGPYALAVLHGERLIGRLDPAFDRRASVLDVRGLWWEPDAPPDALTPVLASIEELGAWLGAREVRLPDDLSKPAPAPNAGRSPGPGSPSRRR